MAYRRVVLSLANIVSEPEEIESRDSVISEVIIARMPDTTSIALHFGRTSDPLTIDAPISFQPDGAESENGLFWTNPVAQPGVTVDVILVTGKRPTLNVELQRI